MSDISNFITQLFKTKKLERSESNNENPYKSVKDILDFPPSKKKQCYITAVSRIDNNESALGQIRALQRLVLMEILTLQSVAITWNA